MGNKDYKQGYADSMKAHEDFLKKQEAATQHIAGEMAKVGEDVGRLGEKIGGITDYITDQEKVELYKLNAPVDIAELEARDKELLWAVLYQLANDEDEITEEQQNYLRAVQNYIGVKDAQVESLDVVEEISDVDTSKAILQAVLEFFYLGTHFGDYTENQADFLDLFNVNPKGRKEIHNHIETIVKAVGIKGLAEKYGFVPAPESEMGSENMQGEPGCGVDPAELQDISIDTILSIPEGETVTYRNKRICVKSYISCDGTLEFINCIIEYGGELGGNVITVNPGGSLCFDSCSICATGSRNCFFISCDKVNACVVTKTILDRCSYFLDGGYSEVMIDSCLIQNPGAEILYFSGAAVENCTIQGEENTSPDITCEYIFSGTSTFNHCTFTNLRHCIDSAMEIKNCVFSNCSAAISNAPKLSDCIFENCFTQAPNDSLIQVGFSARPVTIENCQFICYKGNILDTSPYCTDVTVSYCSFYELEDTEDLDIIQFHRRDSGNFKIEQCIFDGVDLKENYLIWTYSEKKIKHPFVQVIGCTFRWCTTAWESGIMIPLHGAYKKVFGGWEPSKEEIISISKCVGLRTDGSIDERVEEVQQTPQQKTRTVSKDGSGIIGAALDLVASHPVASIIGGSVVGGPIGGLAAGSALLINKIKKD